MTDHIERGSILYDSRRFKMAEDEFRLAIAENPTDSYAHGMLALALAALRRFDEAIKEAKECINLEPDNSWNHYAISFVYYHWGRQKEALNAIEEALRLNPHHATYFGMAAEIHLMRDEWQKALVMAELGLEASAQNVDCLNCRAIALSKLGKHKEAEVSVDQALAHDPENDISHANKASILFRQGKPTESAEHYREALRLNPNSRWAREGILEALKARNPIYFPFAYITAKISDMDRRASLAFALILIFVPPLRSLTFFLLILALAARKFFNLLLLLDPFGKRILTEDERASTACFGVWLAVLVSSIIVFLLFKPIAIVAPLAIVFQVLLLVPLMRIFDVTPGIRRDILTAITAVTAILGIWSIVSSGLGGRDFDHVTESEKMMCGVFVLVCLLSIFYPNGKTEE